MKIDVKKFHLPENISFKNISLILMFLFVLGCKEQEYNEDPKPYNNPKAFDCKEDYREDPDCNPNKLTKYICKSMATVRRINANVCEMEVNGRKIDKKITTK